MSAELMSDSNRKFIVPIIKNNPKDKKLPNFFSGDFYIDFDKGEFDDNYRKLLERIYGIDVSTRPPLGKNPFNHDYINSEIYNKIMLEKETKYSNREMEGHECFDFSNNSGIFTIGFGNYAFETDWSRCGEGSIYCYIDHIDMIGYKPNCSEFPEIDELINFDYSSRVRIIKNDFSKQVS